MLAIALGADHAGWELKEALKAWLIDQGHQVLDFGTHSPDSVDYPDYAAAVARGRRGGKVDRGVLVCGTGIGMAITANKVPGVRAAGLRRRLHARACAASTTTPTCCASARALTGREPRVEIVEIWLDTPFEGGRHARRVEKIAALEQRLARTAAAARMRPLEQVDPEIAKAIRGETERQARSLELIASENFVSEAVLEAVGSVLTNKYAEGYPGRRYYGGCEVVDEVEELAIARAKRAVRRRARQRAAALGLAGQHGRVLRPAQARRHGARDEPRPRRPPHRRQPGELLGQALHDRALRRAEGHRAHRLRRGARARAAAPAEAHHRRRHGVLARHRLQPFREIADEVGAALHGRHRAPRGLVATGLHPTPVPYADFVTTTTHKTLRGPRGGMVLCRAAHAKDLDRAVLPGVQGGPLMHVIAAKAVAFREAQTPEFRAYQGQIVANAHALAEALLARGFRLVSGGTDTHLFLVDLTPGASPARTPRRRSTAPGSP